MQLPNTNPGIIFTGASFTNDEVLLLQNLASLTYATGDILYYDGVNLNNLGIGTEGQTMQVAAGIPSWVTVSAGTGVVQSIVAGQNITVDATDPANPIVTASTDTLFKVHNNTGAILTKGTVVYPTGTSTAGVSNVAKAIANDSNTLEFQLGLISADIENGADGYVMVLGVLDPINTTGLSEGAVYLSPTVAGGLTSTKPTFPDYSLLLGVVDKVGTSGALTVDMSGSISDTFHDTWDGGFRESLDFLVSSDGATITGSLTSSDGLDHLTMLFSDGFTKLNVSPAKTITLVAGTDTNPQINYIYIPKSTKVLTVSTTGFPSDEHIKVADVLVQSATGVQSNDALVNRNWNDHIKTVNDNGHLLHIAERLRQNDAQWDSGIQGTCTIDSPTNSNVYVSTTSGTVYQLHKQTFPAKDTAVSDAMYIINNFATPYFKTQNLNGQTTDALGNSLLNSSFSVVLWGVQNKSGEVSQLMINLPTGKYAKNAPEDAVSDASNYSVYTIPRDFKGKGFLIARFTFTLGPAGLNWTLFDTEDLRGKIPNASAGGGGGGVGVTEFTALSDTPSSYVGQAGKFAKVNVGETALEFTDLTSSDIIDFQTSVSANPDVIANTAKVSYPTTDSTKVGFISVTQPVDLDAIESDTATNNAKVTNATHTGEVTGDTVLTVNPTAISNKTSKSTLAGTEEVLINDAGTLKKTTSQYIADLAGGDIVYTSGVFSRGMKSASGTQYIAHGLGKTPTRISFSAYYGSPTYDISSSSTGVYTSSGNSCISYFNDESAADGKASVYTRNSTSESIFIYEYFTGTQRYQSGVVTADSTNIIITWTYNTAVSNDNIVVLWEAN